jgi:dienelactone hydrolase
MAYIKDLLGAYGATASSDLWAVRDAPLVSDHFPVVIYAPSFSSVSWENADLCEYLATHGYVVIASPNMGPTTRETPADLEGVNTQARDIFFLIGFAASLPDTELSRVAGRNSRQFVGEQVIRHRTRYRGIRTTQI